MRPDTGKGFGRVSCGKPSTVDKKAIVILPNLLYRMIWLGIYVEKKYFTHWSKRACLRWGSFSDSYITMQMHVWGLGILHEVSESKRRLNVTPMNIAYMWWGWVIVCRCHIVIGCVNMALIMHFTLENYISYWLMNALSTGVLGVITCHMRVLRNDTHG